MYPPKYAGMLKEDWVTFYGSAWCRVCGGTSGLRYVREDHTFECDGPHLYGFASSYADYILLAGEMG